MASPKSPAERAAERIEEAARGSFLRVVGRERVAAIIAEEYAPLVEAACLALSQIEQDNKERGVPKGFRETENRLRAALGSEGGER